MMKSSRANTAMCLKIGFSMPLPDVRHTVMTTNIISSDAKLNWRCVAQSAFQACTENEYKAGRLGTSATFSRSLTTRGYNICLSSNKQERGSPAGDRLQAHDML